MAVSFTLHQVTSICDGPLYRVKNEVLASIGAAPNVFVFKTASQGFSHVATVADVELYPAGYDLAVLDGAKFYRLPLVQRDWPTVAEMLRDLAYTNQRVQRLADDLTLRSNSLVIDRTLEIVGV